MALLVDHWGELARGPFAPLLNRDIGPTYASYNPDDAHLAKLESMFPNHSPLNSPLLAPSSRFSSSKGFGNEEERRMDVCRQALDELRRVSSLPYSPTKSICVKITVHIWPGSISQDFVELIEKRYPRALVILAYYCVLLKRCGHVWYLEGLGEGLLGSIWEALGEEWRPWVRWAMEYPDFTNKLSRHDLVS